MVPANHGSIYLGTHSYIHSFLCLSLQAVLPEYIKQESITTDTSNTKIETSVTLDRYNTPEERVTGTEEQVSVCNQRWSYPQILVYTKGGLIHLMVYIDFSYQLHPSLSKYLPVTALGVLFIIEDVALREIVYLSMDIVLNHASFLLHS